MPPLTDEPWLSIVIPLKNEADNVDFVTEAIVAACAELAPYEVIYVDDGSTDATAARVLALAERFPQVRLVQHATSGGQSAAVHSGVTLARGSVICTLDGDGQNPPSEIPKLAALLEGRRLPRRRRADRRAAHRAAGHRLEALGVAGGQRAARAAAEGRHPRHRLRAEDVPARRCS